MSIILHRPTQQEAADLCAPQDRKPQLFLAGPIMGARHWQEGFVSLLSGIVPKDTDVHVSNPRWNTVPTNQRLDPAEQLAWEKRHYRAALDAARLATRDMVPRGVVLFYFTGKSPNAPVPNPPGRPYGQGTGHEFFDAIGTRRAAPYPVHIVMGMDSQFEAQRPPGITAYCAAAEEFGLPIHGDGQSTVLAAVELLLSQPDS